MDARAVGGKSDVIVGGSKAAGNETRMLQARLDILVAALSTAVWINPCLAILWTFPFIGWFPRLGRIALLQLSVIVAIQLAMSVGARIIHRGYKRDPSDPVQWQRRLVAYQGATGMGWGIFAWLVWVPGNPLNNILVTMTVCELVWAYAFSRAMHVGILVAGLAPIVLLTLGRIVYTGSDLAMPLSLIIIITFALIYVLANGTRRQVVVSLQTRFANEDLTVKLRETRDDALRRRFEAEAANASKTTFLANMSHELRTPLNAILGFSELISNETLGPVGTARYKEYANDINTSGAHLLSLINDILDISKIESGKMEIAPTLIDPKSAIESVMSVIEVRAREKRHTVAVDIAPDIEELFTDERAFKQMLINLLSNAVKFTPEGGHIGISMKGAVDGGTQLCVSDDGPGIPAVLLEQIFMPFNQVDNRYSRQAGGTGLGLSLVRGLAELHGGKAWIESDSGKGVRAYVYLPGVIADVSLRRRA